jgi:hypothetical protein
VLRRELSLVRQTCPSLERQQRALVLQAGREAVEAVVDGQVGLVLAGRRAAQRQVDVEAAIHKALQASVAANAASGEAEAYHAEHGYAVERRKQAAVAVLVAEVDRDAFLDAAQREALGRELAAAYRERWRTALGQFQQAAFVGAMPLPPGLDRCVEKVLGKERKAEWLARREAAQKLAGGDGHVQWADHGGAVIVNGGAVQGRVIKRRFVANGMQVEVQIGGGIEAGNAAAAEAEAEAKRAADEK